GVPGHQPGHRADLLNDGPAVGPRSAHRGGSARGAQRTGAAGVTAHLTTGASRRPTAPAPAYVPGVSGSGSFQPGFSVGRVSRSSTGTGSAATLPRTERTVCTARRATGI